MYYRFTVPLNLPDGIDDKRLHELEEWAIEAVACKAKDIMLTDTPDPVIKIEELGLTRVEEQEFAH